MAFHGFALTTGVSPVSFCHFTRLLIFSGCISECTLANHDLFRKDVFQHLYMLIVPVDILSPRVSET